MGRVLLLSRARAPDGRALLFGKALFEISILSGSEAMLITYDLYDTSHDLSVPIVVTLKDDIDTAAFERLCHEHGIVACIGDTN